MDIYIYMHLSSESARIPNSARELNFSSFCDLTNLSYKLAMCRNLRHKGRSRIYTHVYVCIYIYMYIHIFTFVGAFTIFILERSTLSMKA